MKIIKTVENAFIYFPWGGTKTGLQHWGFFEPYMHVYVSVYIQTYTHIYTPHMYMYLYILNYFIWKNVSSHKIWFSDIHYDFLSFSAKLFKCSSFLYFIAVLVTKKKVVLTALWGLSLTFFFQCRKPKFLLSRFQSPQVPGEDTVALLTGSLGIAGKCWDLHDIPYASV